MPSRAPAPLAPRAGPWGLSFALATHPPGTPAVVHLSCHGDPAPVDHPHSGCLAELGAGSRMAEFHDGGGGWGLQGERETGLRAGTRYKVRINDQRGNCWDGPA